MASKLCHLQINVRARIRQQTEREIQQGSVRPDYALYWYWQTFAKHKLWTKLFKAQERPGRVSIYEHYD